VLIFWRQKNYKAKSNQRKAAQFAFVQKVMHRMLMKLTPELDKNHFSCPTIFFGALFLPHSQIGYGRNHHSC